MNTVLIGLTGDVMIGRLVNEHLDTVPPSYIWGDLLPILRNHDLNLINLEAALTTSTQIVPKVFNFKADLIKVRVLQEASISVVNLANNHVLDYSEAGLIETLQTLDKAGIKHVGAGNDLTAARKAVIVTIKGLRIGILGCTDNEPTWIATNSRPGTYYVSIGDLHLIQEDIENLRPLLDILILSIHWGPNMRERPTASFIQFAHKLIDSGVDLIHGHSAHIFQGVEMYKGKLILYDTGDFVDDYYVDPQLRNDRSFLFVVEVNKQGISQLKLIPTLIESFQVNKATGSDASEALQRMQLLSRELGTELTQAHNELYLSCQ